MADVYVAFPSADPAKGAACATKWRAAGYGIYGLLDQGYCDCVGDDIKWQTLDHPWRGYNAEMCDFLRQVPGDVVVLIGDDMDPPPELPPETIRQQFLERFGDTMGIMQPTGDTWLDGAASRICGSPWLGRAWIDRGYGGRGPLWPDYNHFYADEELQNVAQMLGILWQRPDLTQIHHHWSRNGNPRPDYMESKQAKWDQDKALFEQRRDAGFPGHQPKGVRYEQRAKAICVSRIQT